MNKYSENQFVVDLGPLKLSDEQRVKINASIQKAVAGELAELHTAVAKRNVLIPVNKWPDFPFPWGIIIRDWDEVIKKDAIKFNQ